MAVFAAALVCDLVLIPLGFGDDFIAWDIASRATLSGSNIYAHHPAGYPTGPFVYPPLFLYFELPFQYLAQHVGWSFTTMGKVPIVMGDMMCGWLIAKYSGDAGDSDRVRAGKAALYLLNPLVLYNSAFYGRFDSMCLAFFLLALRLHGATRRSRSWFPFAYAAAIGTKIFPAFVAPWFWWNEPRRRLQLVGATVFVLTLICLPYLASSPRAFISDVVVVNLNQYARGLSWQVAFMGALPLQTMLAISYGCLAVFVIVASNWVRSDLHQYCLRIILLFTLLSKIVYEQYFVWTIPFAIIGLQRRPRATAALLAALTVGGMLSNPHIHPFGGDLISLNIALAVVMAVFLLTDRRYTAPPTIA